MSETAILSVNNLSHCFNKHATVLDNVSLTIHKGEKLALIGPNGAGKTTLIQLLVGLEAKQSGEIFLEGQEINSEADFVLLRQQVGLVFQDADDQLFCPSVLEDVMFGPLNQGFNVKQAQQAAMNMLEEMGLSHLSQRIASQLSGGEKRMVTLASVLVMQPKVLLLDEPTNALDSHAKANLLKLLQALDQAMLIISHDQDFLDQLVSGVLALKEGKLSQQV